MPLPLQGTSAQRVVILLAAVRADAIADDDQAFFRPADSGVGEIDRFPARGVLDRLGRRAMVEQERFCGQGHDAVLGDALLIDVPTTQPQLALEFPDAIVVHPMLLTGRKRPFAGSTQEGAEGFGLGAYRQAAGQLDMYSEIPPAL